MHFSVESTATIWSLPAFAPGLYQDNCLPSVDRGLRALYKTNVVDSDTVQWAFLGNVPMCTVQQNTIDGVTWYRVENDRTRRHCVTTHRHKIRRVMAELTPGAAGRPSGPDPINSAHEEMPAGYSADDESDTDFQNARCEIFTSFTQSAITTDNLARHSSAPPGDPDHGDTLAIWLSEL